MLKCGKGLRGYKGLLKLKELTIKNVQSVKKVTIQFDENGVFHLVGANNVGKSTIVKSIRALFLNISDNQYKEMLRDDCDTFSVEGVMWSGDVLKLSRGATDYYQWSINGEEGRMDKTRGKLPSVVEKYVNMYVDIDKTKECLNIRLPRSVLPFVDMTPGENAHLLQKALGTDEFLKATKLAESKRREVAKEVKMVTGYKEREEEKLNRVQGQVSEEKIKLDKVEEYDKVLTAEYATYKAIEDVVLSAYEVQKLSEQVAKAKENLKEVNLKEIKKEIEDMKKMEDLLVIMKDMLVVNKEMKEIKAKIDAVNLEELKGAIDDFRVIEQTLEEAKTATRLKKQVMEAKELYVGADEELGDFMRENKFCPIVAKTINKKCPFSMGEGVFG